VRQGDVGGRVSSASRSPPSSSQGRGLGGRARVGVVHLLPVPMNELFPQQGTVSTSSCRLVLTVPSTSSISRSEFLRGPACSFGGLILSRLARFETGAMSWNCSPSPATTSPPRPSSSMPRVTRRLSTHGGSHKSRGSSEGDDTATTEVVAVAVVAGLLFVALVVACACGGRSRKRRAGAQAPPGGLMFYADSSGFKGA
jgi:hypothetical protein